MLTNLFLWVCGTWIISLFTSQSFSAEKAVTVEHKLLRHVLGTFGCFCLHQGELVPIFWMSGKET